MTRKAASTSSAEGDPVVRVRLQPRKTPTQKRAVERRERIHNIAKEMLAREGVGGLSIARIAAEAGIPNSSVYQIYADKFALLAALVEYRWLVISSVLIDAMNMPPNAPWIDMVRRVVDRFYALNLADPTLDPIYISAQTIPELRRDDLNRMRDASNEIAKLTSALTGIPYDDALMRYQLSATITVASVVRHALLCDPSDAELLLDQVVNMINATLISLGAHRP
ncbi:MAG: TetR/AcrR family transcriptional regulator [Sphingorhabdus sp.]